jgi:hypothetical protein
VIAEPAPAAQPAFAPAAAPVAPVAPAAAPAAPRVVARKPSAPAKKPAVKKAPVQKIAATWVDPDGNICPESHPVKAKLSSKIFQVPGMFAYERTNPDRCYQDPEAAEADGFRAAKR